MPRRSIVNAGRRYLVATDDPASGDLLPHALLRARVIDELTLAPPIAPLSLTSTLPGAWPRVATDGICGLVGRPRDAAARLVEPNGFTARLSAPGYLDRDLTPAIEQARRTMPLPVGAGATMLNVVPTDPGRTQFIPGRGVLVERTGASPIEFFTNVRAVSTVLAPGDVPLAQGLDAMRPPNRQVAGVPMVLPDQPLHRADSLPMRGRAQVRTSPTTMTPAVGALVGMVGVWWDYPSSVNAPPLPPDFCAVAPSLRLAHPVGAPVDACALAPAGAPRSLQLYGDVESMAIVVGPNSGLNPLGGDILRVGDPVTGDDEFVVTAGFDPIADPLAPVTIRLLTPTASLHRSGEPVQAMQITSFTPTSFVARESLPGDTVLFAAGLSALPTTSVIVVEALTPRAVFYRATQMPTTPDGITFNHNVLPDVAGRFDWPAVARITQMRVVASLPPFGAFIDVALDYGGSSTLDLVLT